jgi:cysteine desulfurase
MKRLYLDYAATTPVAPEVLSAMIPYFTGISGNPSSLHREGRRARQAIDEAREVVAEELGCEPTEIVFTSGATEANNLAISGGIASNACRRFVTTSAEHHSVKEVAERLEETGGEVIRVRIGKHGHAETEELLEAATAGDFVSIIWGSNELGALNALSQIGGRLRDAGLIVHTDASQVPAWERIVLRDLPVDLATFSAHKVYGPKGVGALYVRKGIKVLAQMRGGSQERGLRPGTENVAGIVGFAAALRYVASRRDEAARRIRAIRDELKNSLFAAVPDSYCHSAEPMLPHILSFSFRGVKTEVLLAGVDLAGVAASSGSACASGAAERSHVIAALPVPEEQKESSLRLSLGYSSTREEALEAASRIAAVVQQARIRGGRSG